MAALGEKCDPDARFKLLSNLADSVVVDHNIPPMRYFRSGVEMQRMVSRISTDITEAAPPLCLT